MTARVDLSKFEKQLKKILKEFESAPMMKESAEFARDMIVVRTRLGRGTDGPLKRLSPGYVAARRKDPRLSSQTTPGKSNLTRTGQMLASIKVVAQKGKTFIKPTGRRRGIGQSNQDIANYVSEERPFLGFTPVELKRFQQFLAAQLRKIVGRS